MEEPKRRSSEVRISSSRKDVVTFLENLRDQPDFRDDLRSDARSVLLEYRIDISPGALPDPVELPPDDELREQIDRLLGEADRYGDFGAAGYHPLGYAILYMLGAMPLVVGSDAR